MVDEAIEKHIEYGMVRGRSKEEIYSALTRAGWPSGLVNSYLERVQAEIGPAALLKLNAVTKRFGAKTVLENISIEVRPGEILGIIGLSGSGKTTLLKTMAGFLSPDAGDVSLKQEGKTLSVSRNHDLAKKIIGFSTQSPSFYDKLTVRENVEHFAALYGVSQAELGLRTSNVLKHMDLVSQQHQFACELSGGQQKRLDIACSIIHRPRVLILDEPVAELDSISAQKIISLIRQISESGTTIVMASHMLSDLEKLCDRIAILREGKITECGSPEELKEIFSRSFDIIIETDSKIPSLISELKKHGDVFRIKAAEPIVAATNAPKTALRILAGALSKSQVKIRSVSLSKPSLGEVFDSLVKK